MSELTREQIEAQKRHMPSLESLCDMALRTHDAEQRAEQLAKIEQEEVAAREQAEADAHEHRVNYDNLFDEAEKIRHQRDEARQEAARFVEVMKKGRNDLFDIAMDLRCGAMSKGDAVEQMRDVSDNLHDALQSAPPASDPSTEALGREAYPQAYSPAPADAPAGEPPCPACSGEMDVDHTCPPLNLRATDPAPADRPERETCASEPPSASDVKGILKDEAEDPVEAEKCSYCNGLGYWIHRVSKIPCPQCNADAVVVDRPEPSGDVPEEHLDWWFAREGEFVRSPVETEIYRMARAYRALQQPAPAVPEKKRPSQGPYQRNDVVDANIAWACGWNDCRRAIAAASTPTDDGEVDE